MAKLKAADIKILANQVHHELTKKREEVLQINREFEEKAWQEVKEDFATRLQNAFPFLNSRQVQKTLDYTIKGPFEQSLETEDVPKYPLSVERIMQMIAYENLTTELPVEDIVTNLVEKLS